MSNDIIRTVTIHVVTVIRNHDCLWGHIRSVIAATLLHNKIKGIATVYVSKKPTDPKIEQSQEFLIDGASS